MALLMHISGLMADSTKTILLVDDDADLRELLTIAVRYLGYNVVVAATGKEAVERASTGQPNLILMDIDLPNFDGAEATAKIKRNRKTGHIPIVILTGFGISPDTKRALESGAAEILRKPVSILKIKEVLRKHLPVEVETSRKEI